MEFWNLTEVCFGKKCLARPWLCTLSELNGAVYGTQKNKLAVNVFPGVFLGMQAARDVHIDIRKKKRRPWFLIHAPDRVYEGGVVRLQPRASSVVICVSCTDFHPPFTPLSLSLSLSVLLHPSIRFPRDELVPVGFNLPQLASRRMPPFCSVSAIRQTDRRFSPNFRWASSHRDRVELFTKAIQDTKVTDDIKPDLILLRSNWRTHFNVMELVRNK